MIFCILVLHAWLYFLNLFSYFSCVFPPHPLCDCIFLMNEAKAMGTVHGRWRILLQSHWQCTIGGLWWASAHGRKACLNFLGLPLDSHKWWWEFEGPLQKADHLPDLSLVCPSPNLERAIIYIIEFPHTAVYMTEFPHTAKSRCRMFREAPEFLRREARDSVSEVPMLAFTIPHFGTGFLGMWLWAHFL